MESSSNPWKLEEDIKLLQLRAQLGPDWSKIARKLSGSTSAVEALARFTECILPPNKRSGKRASTLEHKNRKKKKRCRSKYDVIDLTDDVKEAAVLCLQTMLRNPSSHSAESLRKVYRMARDGEKAAKKEKEKIAKPSKICRGTPPISSSSSSSSSIRMDATHDNTPPSHLHRYHRIYHDKSVPLPPLIVVPVSSNACKDEEKGGGSHNNNGETREDSKAQSHKKSKSREGKDFPNEKNNDRNLHNLKKGEKLHNALCEALRRTPLTAISDICDRKYYYTEEKQWDIESLRIDLQHLRDIVALYEAGALASKLEDHLKARAEIAIFCGKSGDKCGFRKLSILSAIENIVENVGLGGEEVFSDVGEEECESITSSKSQQPDNIHVDDNNKSTRKTTRRSKERNKKFADILSMLKTKYEKKSTVQITNLMGEDARDAKQHDFFPQFPFVAIVGYPSEALYKAVDAMQQKTKAAPFDHHHRQSNLLRISSVPNQRAAYHGDGKQQRHKRHGQEKDLSSRTHYWFARGRCDDDGDSTASINVLKSPQVPTAVSHKNDKEGRQPGGDEVDSDDDALPLLMPPESLIEHIVNARRTLAEQKGGDKNTGTATTTTTTTTATSRSPTIVAAAGGGYSSDQEDVISSSIVPFLRGVLQDMEKNIPPCELDPSKSWSSCGGGGGGDDDDDDDDDDDNGDGDCTKHRMEWRRTLQTAKTFSDVKHLVATLVEQLRGTMRKRLVPSTQVLLVRCKEEEEEEEGEEEASLSSSMLPNKSKKKLSTPQSSSSSSVAAAAATTTSSSLVTVQDIVWSLLDLDTYLSQITTSVEEDEEEEELDDSDESTSSLLITNENERQHSGCLDHEKKGRRKGGGKRTLGMQHPQQYGKIRRRRRRRRRRSRGGGGGGGYWNSLKEGDLVRYSINGKIGQTGVVTKIAVLSHQQQEESCTSNDFDSVVHHDKKAAAAADDDDDDYDYAAKNVKVFVQFAYRQRSFDQTTIGFLNKWTDDHHLIRCSFRDNRTTTSTTPHDNDINGNDNEEESLLQGIVSLSTTVMKKTTTRRDDANVHSSSSNQGKDPEEYRSSSRAEIKGGGRGGELYSDINGKERRDQVFLVLMKDLRYFEINVQELRAAAMGGSSGPIHQFDKFLSDDDDKYDDEEEEIRSGVHSMQPPQNVVVSLSNQGLPPVVKSSSSSSLSSTPSPLPSHHLPPLKKTTTTGLYCRNNSRITRTFTVYDAPTADDSPELLKAFNILHQKAFSDSSSPTPQSTAATHHHHHLPNVSSPVAPPHRLFSTEDHPVNKRRTGWSKQQQQQQQQQNSSSAASSSSSSSTLVPFTRSRSQPVPTCILTSNTPTQHQREEEEKNKQTARRGPWGRRDERLRCAICQHHIRRDSGETIAALDCAHEYHEKCLHAFIEHERANANESYLCPVCRNDIQTVTFQNNETTSTCGRYPQRKRKIPIKSLILSCNKRKKTV